MPKIRITAVLKLETEMEFNEETYPDMTLEQAVELERSDEQKGEFIFEATSGFQDKDIVLHCVEVIDE